MSIDIINVTSILPGNAGFNLTNTATATLITVAADKILKINTITVANVDGTNAATVDLFVDGLGSGVSGITTNGQDATVYLAKTISVPADELIDVPPICKVVPFTSPLEPYITALLFTIVPAEEPSTKLSSAPVEVIAVLA